MKVLWKHGGKRLRPIKKKPERRPAITKAKKEKKKDDKWVIDCSDEEYHSVFSDLNSIAFFMEVLIERTADSEDNISYCLAREVGQKIKAKEAYDG
jgi:hypothetical protein